MSQINRGSKERRFTVRIRIRKPSIAAIGGWLFAVAKNPFVSLRRSRWRWHIIAAAVVLVLGTAYDMLYGVFQQNAYALDPKSSALLPESSPVMAQKVKFDAAQGLYNFEPAPSAASNDLLGQAAYASASLHQDPRKGITVTDPVHKIDFTMTPKFKLKDGRKSEDKVVYPLADGSGWAVYTLRGDSVKEDIVLSYARGDTMSYSYALGLGEGLKAKVEQDGSLGIYGDTLLSGNVTTATDKDAELLQKAQKNAPKNTLLFSMPAPVVVDAHGPANGITANYSLDGDTLTVTTTGMKKGNYPLSIDPTIYVATAKQFMQGNNEGNISFDVNNKLIKKSAATGARLDSWTSTTSLPTAVWGEQAVATGGYIYQVGGTSSSGATSSVNWAELNASTGTVDSANPGNGACSNWCTNSVYNLPDGRANFSLVTYNGFLYAMGGTSSNCTSGNGTGTSTYCKTVYIAKLGANGEPRLWHPTDTNPANWVYWYRDTDLPNERAYSGAVAYNNRMYFMGGRTSSGTVGSVHIANILPNGKLGSWTASGNTLPTSNQMGVSVQVYNDRLYAIGGLSSSAVVSNAVYYSKINSDGTINSWVQTASFATARLAYGGNLSVIWGGYVYLSGGCSAINGNGFCTTTQSDTQLASINADGSLDSWTTLSSLSDSRLGHTLVAWRDYIYTVGGCSSQNTTTGDCNSNVLSSIKYGKVSQLGDVSNISPGTASGTAPCNGSTPTNCTYKASTMLATLTVNAGYLYVIGGCTNAGCTSTSSDISFTTLTANGNLVRPASCPASAPASGGWCVMSGIISGGRAAASVVNYFGYMWLLGGITGSGISNTWSASQYNSDGTITSAQSGTLSGVGATAVSSAYAAVRANPSGSPSSNAGNLYIFGGCTTNGSGPACSNFTGNVYKCNISIAAVLASCSTTSQLQIGTITGASGAGLAAASGTMYANYIYLVGGSAPGLADTNTVRYAKFDSSNNVVVPSGSGWTESPQTLANSSRYGTAVGYNGYLYYIGGISSSTLQGSINFIKLNTSDGSLDSGGWKISSINITSRWGLSAIASGGYVYMIGGCTSGAAPASCSALSSLVDRVKVFNNNSGGPASWSTSANSYSTARWLAGSAVLNGYIYVAGGCTEVNPGNNDCKTVTANVSYAALDANGAVGSWSNTTAALPVALGGAKLLPINNTLYFVGGATANYASMSSTVYYATPSSGNVTSWSTASNGLPQGRTLYGATVWNNRIYVLGGSSTSCGSYICNTVYISPQLNSGGNITTAWSTSSNSLSGNRFYAAAASYSDTLYVIGGIDSNLSYLSDVQYSKINTSTGDIGSWNTTTALPNGIASTEAIATNGYLYLFGGGKNNSSTNCMSTILAAPISSNTGIASGGNPTGVGDWFETSAQFSGGRYAAGAAYNDGKVYLTGGLCNNAGVSPNIQQTALLSQPQTARYSIVLDTDTDVYPLKWLLNGAESSAGTRWQLSYKSMTDPGAATQCGLSSMSNWGQVTNFGNITLGLPGLYTPLDSSGINTNCARYFSFNVSISAKDTYTFPEYTAQSPTITDLTLNYTANPAKRLMHGRTFVGGLQMPNDTNYYAN